MVKQTGHATRPELYEQGARPVTHRRLANYTLLLTENCKLSGVPRILRSRVCPL